MPIAQRRGRMGCAASPSPNASAALDALAHGWDGVHARLAQARRREFAVKWRFNRTVRSLVASRPAVAIAAASARLAPSVLRHAMVYAGDCA